MNLKYSSLPSLLGGLLAIVAVATASAQILSGLPWWSETGPISFVQAILTGCLALPCAVVAFRSESQRVVRTLWTASAIGLAAIALLKIVYLAEFAAPEPKTFDYPAAAAWGAAAVALLLLEHLESPLGRSLRFLRVGFALHSLAFLADVADGGVLRLSAISVGTLGSAEEVLEFLCLSAYFAGLTLLALDMVAGALWRTFDCEPKPLPKVLAAAFRPLRDSRTSRRPGNAE